MKNENSEFKGALLSLGQIPKQNDTKPIEKMQKCQNNLEKLQNQQNNKKYGAESEVFPLSAKKTPEKGQHQSKLSKLKKEISNENVECNEQNQQVYGTWLRNCLREAIEENDNLRNRVMELEALFAAAQDEIEIRNKAIIELSNAMDELKLENIQLKYELKSSSVEEKNGKQKL